MESTQFNVKEHPVVGYVNAQGQTLLAQVNGVSSEGNPSLAVISQVPNAPHDENRAPGTWHYLDAEQLAPLQAPVELETAPSAPLEAVEPALTRSAPVETHFAGDEASETEVRTVEINAPEGVSVVVSQGAQDESAG